MEAKVLRNMQFSTHINLDAVERTPTTSVSLSCYKLEKWVPNFTLKRTSCKKAWPRLVLTTSGSYKRFSASTLETGSRHEFCEDNLVFQSKTQEVMPYLEERCVYLVGMMGSGKTTVGRILSDAMGYCFRDSDKLVEHTLGASVADIFRMYGEGYFREKESEELQNLSMMKRLVVSTGGGAVVRPINWTHMQKGVTIWIDVPLEALARRIAAIGTDSRPLLDQESGDAYTKALRSLNILWAERGHAYANADIKLSLDHVAAKLGYRDVLDLSPAVIALEALEKIEHYLKRN